MVREVLTLNGGQCGIQLGQAVWEQYCAEHKIDKTGSKKNKDEKGIALILDKLSIPYDK